MVFGGGSAALRTARRIPYASGPKPPVRRPSCLPLLAATV